jgi:hypothetical protein
MKNNLLKLFFVVVLFCSVSLLFNSSSEAGECERTGTSINIDQQDDGTNEFVVNGIEASGYGQMNCVEEPLFYKVSFYKVLFCREDPYVSNGNPDLSSCIGTIFETNLTTGKEVIVQPGLKTDLLDEALVLPVGTYPYAAIIVDNHIGLKHHESYIDKDGSTAVSMRGATGAGAICYTRDGKATTYTGTAAGTHTSGLHPSGLAFTAAISDTRSTLTMECGSALPNDWSDTAKYFSYEIIDSIDGGACDTAGNCATTFNAYVDYEADDSGVGGQAASTLLKANEQTIATQRSDAVKIGYFLKFTTPKTIDDDINSLELNFTTSTSVSVDHSKDGTTVYGMKVGANPFGVQFVIGTE